MSNVSAVTNHFSTANEGFITTLGSTILAGAVTVPLTSVSGLTNGTIFVGIIEPGETNQQTFTGTVDTAGVQITGVKWTRGNNVDHTAGVTIVDYVSGTGHNMFTKGITVEHNQDGTHDEALITSRTEDTDPDPDADFVLTYDDSASALKKAKISNLSGAADGWVKNVLPSVSTVTANGNRSYTLAFSSSVASTLSEGMRLRLTRTSAAPQTSFSLDGTNDFYNDTTVAGMTFTDDFSVSAWVYLTAYGSGNDTMIASRYNGTSGWFFGINQSSGLVRLVGRSGGASNTSEVVSYQSIPLNRWVHIAAQLDMSAFTATTTTSYIMIDGVNVPAQVTRGGTNPTSLTQAGNLEIGSINGGSSVFSGYLDQVAIYSAKVTQATHLAAMNQALTGSETSLISAYSNGSTTDLNTTNANNLTAQNGATTAAVSPFGNSTSSTLDYALVMAVSGTDVTVQVPSGCTIPTTGGVSAVAYSTQANPYGWVSGEGRWEITTVAKSNMTQSSPVADTWYNVNYTIWKPTGNYVAHYELTTLATTTAAQADVRYKVTLSSSSSAETDDFLTSRLGVTAGSSTWTAFTIATRRKQLSSTASGTYYALIQSNAPSAAATIQLIGSGNNRVSLLPVGL